MCTYVHVRTHIRITHLPSERLWPVRRVCIMYIHVHNTYTHVHNILIYNLYIRTYTCVHTCMYVCTYTHTHTHLPSERLWPVRKVCPWTWRRCQTAHTGPPCWMGSERRNQGRPLAWCPGSSTTIIITEVYTHVYRYVCTCSHMYIYGMGGWEGGKVEFWECEGGSSPAA